jgi:predicted nucleic acid-binding protein
VAILSDGTIKIYIDNNVYDEIVLVEAIRKIVFSAALEGIADFVYSSVTQDELEATPNGEKAEKRAALLAVMKDLPSRTPTSPVVLDMSYYGDAKYGDETADSIYDKLRGRFGPKDALHVSTANAAQCDYFVTNDKKLISSVNDLGLDMRAIDVSQLVELLKSLPGD